MATTQLRDEGATGENSFDSDFSGSRYSHNLSPNMKEELRLRVNARERERMHDINGAMDALRQVMPYGNGPSVKKLSKMSTLLLARNYILTLNKNMEQLKFCVAKVCMEQNRPIPPNVACSGPVSPVLANPMELSATSAGLPGYTPSCFSPRAQYSASERAVLYRTVIPGRDSAKHCTSKDSITLHPNPTSDNDHSVPSHVFSDDVVDSHSRIQFGEYPEHKKDMTSRRNTKLICKSRFGRPCLCVECLTKN